MRGADRSERTIGDRLIILTALGRHCDPMTAAWPELSTWLNTPGWQRGTKRTYYQALRAWFSWLVIVGHRLDNPTLAMPRPKAQRGVPRPTSTNDLGRILAAANRRRTRTMILLAAYQALRVHEVALMRGEYLRNGRVRVIGKGGVDADVPAHDFIEEEALDYPQIGLWFPSYADPAVPVTAKNVSRVISDTMTRAGVKGSAHHLRHWAATEMLEAGIDIRTVQEILRHASLATTAIYTKVNDEKRRAAIASLPRPLAIAR